jgi:predicted nucleic acid-binding protein
VRVLQELDVVVAPTLVIGEVAYLVGRRLGAPAQARFAASVASGDVIVEPVTVPDWSRIAELVARYRDLRLGVTDASVIAAAERVGARTIVTLDRRRFSAVRPRHADAFELLPD